MPLGSEVNIGPSDVVLDGVAAPLKLAQFPRSFRGELGLNLTQCRLGRGLPLYQVAS